MPLIVDSAVIVVVTLMMDPAENHLPSLLLTWILLFSVCYHSTLTFLMMPITS